MPLLVPHKSPVGEFTAREGSHLTSRPAVDYGTSLTPGNNAYGTAVQVGVNTTLECWGLHINVNSINVSAAAKDSLTQIGIDFSGGATFPVTPTKYNSITLLTSCAANYASNGHGVNYYFPLYLPAGTSIMARGSTNNGTVGTQNVNWIVYGRPKNPEAVRRGQFVQSMGIVEAGSNGTTLTPGTTSEGTAVSVGTVDVESWYWEWGRGCNDSTMTATAMHTDILMGASSGPVIVENLVSGSASAEAIRKPASLEKAPIYSVAAGTEIFARMQCSGAVDSNNSVAVYAVQG